MQKDNILKYYNSPELWDAEPSPFQMEICQLVLDKIPEDVTSILDVGCGNGIITNILAKSYPKVCAVDISEEALKYVTTEKKIGSIDDLPFDDQSFDLILVSDVLEHLPIDIFNKGIKELQRVAKKYILIVTPFREKLEFGQMICGSCKCSFHVNLHIRSIDKKTIESAFSNQFYIAEMALAGDEWIHIPGYAKDLRSKYSYSNYWDQAVCPQCGLQQNQDEAVKNEVKTNPVFYEESIDMLHNVIDDFRKTEFRKNEALFLLSRDRVVLEDDSELSIQIETTEEVDSVEFISDGKWNINLANPYYERTHTVYFGYKPYIVKNDHFNISNVLFSSDIEYRCIEPNISGANRMIFVIPKFTDKEFNITIEYQDVSQEVLSINVYDRNRSYISLGHLESVNDGRWKKTSFVVPAGLKCSPEGYIFEITSQEKIKEIHPIRYISVNDQNHCSEKVRIIRNDNKVVINFNRYINQSIEANSYIKCRFPRPLALESIKSVSLNYRDCRINLDFAPLNDSCLIEIPSELIQLLCGNEQSVEKQPIHYNDSDQEELSTTIVNTYQQAVQEYQSLSEQFKYIHSEYEKALVTQQNQEAELKAYKGMAKDYEKLIVRYQNRVAELESLNKQYVQIHQEYEKMLVHQQNQEAEIKAYKQMNKNYENQLVSYQNKVAELESIIASLQARIHHISNLGLIDYIKMKRKSGGDAN